jgi:Carboxypeptidase regulatory-like domain
MRSRIGIRRIGAGAMVLAEAAALSAQVWPGGNGRLDGTVVDQNGNPIADATVQLRLKGQGPDLETDKKGKWAILGITGGTWNVDVSAPASPTISRS